MAKYSLPSTPDAPKRRRKRMMSDSEIITILICFHFNSYRNFKHFYLGCVCNHWKHLFPKTFSYNRIVEVMPRCFVALTMFLKLACFGEYTGISFVDSTCVPVVHSKRQFSMKVFKGIAEKGKSTMGWYVGFKLHLLCNEKGEIVNFVLTKANVDDRNETVIEIRQRHAEECRTTGSHTSSHRPQFSDEHAGCHGRVLLLCRQTGSEF